MNQRSSITLSKAAFVFNSEQIKKAAGPSQVAIVLKSNAYGHGLSPMAQLAQEDPNIAWICTAGIQEALQVRALGVTKPLLALSYFDGSLDQAVSQDIHLGLYTIEGLADLHAAAQRVGKKAYAHIKIDTGMSRLGLHPQYTLSFIKAAQEFPNVELYGIFTHLCDTPNIDQTFSYQQLAQFDEVLDLIEAAGIAIPCTHALSSSALCIKPQRPYSFVRAGAAFYGIWKSPTHRELVRKLHPDFDLKPVLQWKTRIIELKKIPAGASVGYDRTWRAQRPTILAIAPVGYYDGYDRRFSNRGVAVIKDQYAPVAGIVSMGLTAFDVTDIPYIHLHDEIVLLGDAPRISAHECAYSAQIITNELVTGLQASLERTIVPEHKPLIIQAPSHEGEIRPHAPQKSSTPVL